MSRILDSKALVAEAIDVERRLALIRGRLDAADATGQSMLSMYMQDLGHGRGDESMRELEEVEDRRKKVLEKIRRILATTETVEGKTDEQTERVEKIIRRLVDPNSREISDPRAFVVEVLSLSRHMAFLSDVLDWVDAGGQSMLSMYMRRLHDGRGEEMVRHFEELEDRRERILDRIRGTLATMETVEEQSDEQDEKVEKTIRRLLELD